MIMQPKELGRRGLLHKEYLSDWPDFCIPRMQILAVGPTG